MLNIIKEHTDYFYIRDKKGENKSLIFLFMPFLPFKEEETLYIIDNYYFNSQRLYQVAKQMKQKLNESGCETIGFNGNLKQLFSLYEIGTIFKNTLLYMYKYGSFVCLQVLECENLGFEYGEIEAKLKFPCHNCNICKQACPSSAISDMGFIKEKCLRDLQYSQNYGEINKKIQKNKILGCSICQTSCPFNSVEKSEIPPELKNILLKDNFENLVKETLWKNCDEGNGANSTCLATDKDIFNLLGTLIGKNYARRKFLKQLID